MNNVHCDCELSRVGSCKTTIYNSNQFSPTARSSSSAILYASASFLPFSTLTRSKRGIAAPNHGDKEEKSIANVAREVGDETDHKWSDE